MKEVLAMDIVSLQLQAQAITHEPQARQADNCCRSKQPTEPLNRQDGLWRARYDRRLSHVSTAGKPMALPSARVRNVQAKFGQLKHKLQFQGQGQAGHAGCCEEARRCGSPTWRTYCALQNLRSTCNSSTNTPRYLNINVHHTLISLSCSEK